MSDDDFANYIRREVYRAMASQAQPTAGTISAYDPNTHSIKVMMQPEGVETGWFRHGSPSIGNGFGLAIGPAIGDQVVIGFHGGNIETPHIISRLPSDSENPPVAQSGEVVLQDQHGTKVTLTGSGLTTVVGGTTLNIALGGAVTLNASAGVTITADMTVNGSLTVAGGTMTHNGVNIGSDHTHIDVQPGPSNTGVPAS